MYVKKFFDEKDKFWDHGIIDLPERWQKTMEQSSKYFVQ